jgi:hypothetical protein
VALDDALTPEHARSPDVDKLGVFGKQLPETLRILGVQRLREGIDEVPRLVKSGIRD